VVGRDGRHEPQRALARFREQHSNPLLEQRLSPSEGQW
jgi:hypothetical protein